MNPVISYITVDLSANNNFDYVRAVQGDKNTRYVHITLLDHQKPYILSNVEPVLRGTKTDGTTIFNKCGISDDNKIIVEIDEQLTVCAGKSNYEIALYGIDEGECLTSFPFILYVTPSSIDPSSITSSDEFTELTSIMKNIGSIVNSVDDAKNAAEVATNKADEALENANDSANSAVQSREYSESAKKSVAEAENQANLSLQYAQDAETSATTASQMATNASTYADQSLEYAEYSEQKSLDSENSALLSKSYAVGDTGVRDGEDVDNSKYYAERAANSSMSAANYLEQVESAGDDAVNKINNAVSMNTPSFHFEPSNGHLYYKGGRFTWVLDENTGHLYWEVGL